MLDMPHRRRWESWSDCPHSSSNQFSIFPGLPQDQAYGLPPLRDGGSSKPEGTTSGSGNHSGSLAISNCRKYRLASVRNGAVFLNADTALYTGESLSASIFHGVRPRKGAWLTPRLWIGRTKKVIVGEHIVRGRGRDTSRTGSGCGESGSGF